MTVALGGSLLLYIFFVFTLQSYDYFAAKVFNSETEALKYETSTRKSLALS